jgi:hypothetical protein
VPVPKPFVLKILISKFFENYILRDPFSETRAGQGFQRYRKKKIHPESASRANSAQMGE